MTAKLSQEFYERFGNAIANELVEWFNSVDATYRADLGELNELNFARFDVKLERRLAELRAELRTSIATLELRVDARFDSLEARLLGRLETRIAEVRTEMLRWMLASWSTVMLVLLGTLFAVLRTR